mmetsp:Transcript_7881/g.12827  ORF Transcript_7881/g.12827 Transcript_7881/m.12827 type:complete len:271 (+) Transcript_7881:482-1294(+)
MRMCFPMKAPDQQHAVCVSGCGGGRGRHLTHHVNPRGQQNLPQMHYEKLPRMTQSAHHPELDPRVQQHLLLRRVKHRILRDVHRRMDLDVEEGAGALVPQKAAARQGLQALCCRRERPPVDLLVLGVLRPQVQPLDPAPHGPRELGQLAPGVMHQLQVRQKGLQGLPALIPEQLVEPRVERALHRVQDQAPGLIAVQPVGVPCFRHFGAPLSRDERVVDHLVQAHGRHRIHQRDLGELGQPRDGAQHLQWSAFTSANRTGCCCCGSASEL